MKKTYITPSIKEVKAMQQHVMITGSISDVTVDPTEDTNKMDAKEGYWDNED